MVDRVKPLKVENLTDGSDDDLGYPSEVDPSEDYLAVKGLAFENDDNYRLEKLGRMIINKWPDYSIKPTYLANGEVNYLEFFKSSVQVTVNRLARVTMSYDANDDPDTETWLIYDTNGTTVLRTITYTHTFTSGVYTKSVSATT